MRAWSNQHIIGRNRQEEGEGEIRYLSASLIYDTRNQAYPRGLRAVAQRARSVLLIADEFEVLLEVSPDALSGRSKIMGQLSLEGLPFERAGVRLSGPVDHPEQTTDGDGAFRLFLLTPGDYRVVISTPRHRIDAPLLNL